MYKSILLTLFIFLIVIIFILIIYQRKVVDSFDNIFTKSSCCNESEIANCETYGKTGVCNYILNNNSCLCQNSF